jgi:uncharacterized protein (DUF2132 family)
VKPETSTDPLHGVTLEQMLLCLAEHLGWEAMGRAVPIRCFTHDPGLASSLKFLRRTPWARARVEALYLRHQPFPSSRAADAGAAAPPDNAR